MPLLPEDPERRAERQAAVLQLLADEPSKLVIHTAPRRPWEYLRKESIKAELERAYMFSQRLQERDDSVATRSRPAYR